MKKILFLTTVLLTVFSSCKDDDFEPLNDVAECTWHLSSEDGNAEPIIIGLNKYLALMDLSQGAISHRWEVSETGTKFLSGEMQWGQTDFTNMIDESIPHVNDLKLISVYFEQPGQHTIRLCNTFHKPVTYFYSKWNKDLGKSEKFQYVSKLEGDVYVMDTTFVVDVYAPELEPGVKVYRDAECTVEVETGITGGTDENPEYKTVEIEYGDKLYFKDASYDRPNSWIFNCQRAGIVKVEAETADAITPLLFRTLTSAEGIINDKPLTVNYTVERVSDPDNKYVPTAVAKTITIPLSIVVKPSSAPLDYTIKQVDQTHINVYLNNSQFKADVNELDHSTFSLNWTNENSNAQSGTVSFSSAKIVKSETGNKDLIQLEIANGDKIYNTDKMYLSCTENANVLFDGKGFSIPAPSEPNVITTYGFFFDDDFEDPSTDKNWNLTINGKTPTPYSFVDNPDPDEINASARCFKADAVTVGCRTMSSKTFLGTVGKYTLRFKYYLVNKGTDGLSPSFVPEDKIGTTAPNGLWQKSGGWLHLLNKPGGQWTEFSCSIEGIKELEVALSMRFNGFKDEIYFDDFFFGYIEERP